MPASAKPCAGDVERARGGESLAAHRRLDTHAGAEEAHRPLRELLGAVGRDQDQRTAAIGYQAAPQQRVLRDGRFAASSEPVNLLRILACRRGCGELWWCYCVGRVIGLGGSRSVSGNSKLFGDLPEQPLPEAPGRGMPRLRQPERHQLGWQVTAIDDLVARDHPVRAVWAFVQRLDLRALHDAVKAREGVPGQAPPAPELMMALWLWATVDGVGSARQLARLCEQHLAYRWLCGGVSMNYHTLSDFRVAHTAVLDQLLAGGVAARVERLRTELEADPAAGDRRQRAAQQRAAREREERVKAALDRMSELEAERTRREKTNKAEVSRRNEPRASTTDAEARAMKLADGGFRPAYNMQIVSAPKGQVIVAVDIDTTGSDRGLARPALERWGKSRTRPSDYLVDGGFTK